MSDDSKILKMPLTGGMQMKGGKILLKFQLREFPEGIPGDDGSPFGLAPPHWTMKDPNDVVTCWGHVGNGSFASMVALMNLAKIGAQRATHEELVEMGLVVKRKIWTPDDGGDESMATHIGETGGFFDGKRQES